MTIFLTLETGNKMADDDKKLEHINVKVTGQVIYFKKIKLNFHILG